MFFTSDRVVRGNLTHQYDKPEWAPLLELAPDHIDDFMWMSEVELESGLRLHIYKHIERRKTSISTRKGGPSSTSGRERNAMRIPDIGKSIPSACSKRCCAGGPSDAEVLPPRVMQMVKKWARQHEAELMANWARARDHQPLRPIDPLR